MHTFLWNDECPCLFYLRAFHDREIMELNVSELDTGDLGIRPRSILVLKRALSSMCYKNPDEVGHNENLVYFFCLLCLKLLTQ